MSGTTTILYLGGTGRSGSTVLANLLGETEGFVSVGEVRFLWDRGMREHRLCGCGVPFDRCAYWKEVLDLAYPAGIPDPAEVISLLNEQTRLRQLPSMLLARHDSDTLNEVLLPLYRAIATVAGADVVVDASKLPTYARLLDGVAGLDVKMLHLVRDPRAAAFSWRRVKELNDQGDRAFMERRGVVKSAGLWSVWNGALEYMWRGRVQKYHRVAYEEFVSNPDEQLRGIMAGLGLAGQPWLALTSPQTLRVSTHHTVAGNPSRMRSGTVQLRLDDEWRAAMPATDRALVRTLAAPIMSRYGYLRDSELAAAS